MTKDAKTRRKRVKVSDPESGKQCYFVFVLDEHNYKRVSFSKHHLSQRKALRESDENATVIVGVDLFEKYAKEAYYRIDWINKVLIFEEEKFNAAVAAVSANIPTEAHKPLDKVSSSVSKDPSRD